ncbi:Gfo/Idh/MocA family protein [Halomonas sp. B23F22_10]|uniref:Gfo/Idh/MocA family protein n=1 Tax=Halomonas sp. B23F22_10 TaxID=3459515 RepID=UPI00373F57DA
MSNTRTRTIKPVRWGILGTANIAVDQLIPAMHASPWCEPWAIGSRDLDKARRCAREMGIPHAHDSYAAVLDDPEVEAVYIPLPNHLHVEYARMAMDRGKHVLCEKPIAMTAAEAEVLADVPQGIVLGEAFMVRHQPRWVELRKQLRDQAIGEVRAVQALLSFTLDSPGDFRLRREYGGGAIFDLGCYASMTTRYLFDTEPQRVMALIERDPEHEVDIRATAILDYGQGRHASFTVSTAMAATQHLHVVGSTGAIDLPFPFAPQQNASSTIIVDRARALNQCAPEPQTFAPAAHYECEVTNFARVIRGESAPHFDIRDAIANMRVLDALFASGESGTWQPVT